MFLQSQDKCLLKSYFFSSPFNNSFKTLFILHPYHSLPSFFFSHSLPFSSLLAPLIHPFSPVISQKGTGPPTDSSKVRGITTPQNQAPQWCTGQGNSALLWGSQEAVKPPWGPGLTAGVSHIEQAIQLSHVRRGPRSFLCRFPGCWIRLCECPWTRIIFSVAFPAMFLPPCFLESPSLSLAGLF